MEALPDILTLKKVNKCFPGVKALVDVDFSLREGEVHALVGENGAGKSTLMKILSGAYKRDSGTIEICGEKVEITSPKQAEKLGISIIYQELNLIQRVTVAENVFLGRYPKKCGLVQWQKMNEDTKALFDGFGIKIDVEAVLRNISLAQQQIVEIIKAVSINAKVVIMDEPTSSLTSQETEVLFNIIRTLKAKGIAVIFITHRLNEIYEICDRLTVLRDGCFIGTRDVKDVSQNELISMMIGRELTQQYPVRDSAVGDIVLEVNHLSDGGHRVKDISFAARKGEVVGFGGLVGAGRTETMRIIFGADKKTSGEILINGQKVEIKNPRHAVSHGIGFLTENRKEEGLFLKSSIRFNTVVVSPQKILHRGKMFFDFKKEKKIATDYVQALRTVTPSVNQRAMFLSGGNQQKVVLAKWLFADSQIVIFDEPTRGIDVGAKREIYEIINSLAAQGKVILVVSSDMEEIMGISDRILIMHEGTISGEVAKSDFSQSLIMKFAVGENNK
ncbi:MAG: sugar ABC transporter ATP-binding protein [Ruminococcaceae bacterium]|nr:sugar ABC transporter ATP-binding protein [Oscillospiraceae bacterium]